MAAFKDYERYDAVGLAQLIRAGEVSVEEVVEAAISRVEARNPALNAVVEPMFDEARRFVAAGVPDGPLAGVPFMLKDLGAMYAGVPMRHGSDYFKDFVAPHDSHIVSRYKAAGLVTIGKTATPELGVSLVTESRVHGITRNPWNLDRGAGGSSGGAAAAVAGGMVPAAHGSDGAGSIRMPSSACGLFGLKPSRGRVSAGPDAGEWTAGLSMHHAITRTVRDSAALLDAIEGNVPGDPYGAPTPARPFAEEVGADPGRRRIAFTKTAPSGKAIDADCIAAVEAAAKLCESLGHDVEEAAPVYDNEAAKRAEFALYAVGLNAMLGAAAQFVGRPVAKEDLNPAVWAWAQAGERYTGVDQFNAVAFGHRMARLIAGFMADYDLLLSPTNGVGPLPHGAVALDSDDAEAYAWPMFEEMMPFTLIYNLTGQPAASLPLHWNDEGLPIGVQFAAGYGQEATIFRIAAQLEAAAPWADRRPADFCDLEGVSAAA